MELEPKVAQDIVDNLKEIVHHEINLFDVTGTIIASTDLSRVGTFHDGAYQAIQKRHAVVVNSDEEFNGARAGTNLPVLFNESVVAVIGITGEADEVAPLGNIIKKMTEILIRENWSQMTRYARQSNVDSLISQLINRERDDSLVDYLMAVLEIDANVPRQVIIGKFLNRDTHVISYAEASEALPRDLVNYPNSFYSTGNFGLILMIEQLPSNQLNRLLVIIQHEMQTISHQQVTFGIGRTVSNINDYWLSYQDAKAVTSWQLFHHLAVVTHYNELDIGMLISTIPKTSVDAFRKKVLNKIPVRDFPEYKAVMKAYIEQNGSIIHGANTLFIHKNTFQNKLNHIRDLTGYNPRELKDFVVLYLAFALNDYYTFLNQYQ